MLRLDFCDESLDGRPVRDVKRRKDDFAAWERRRYICLLAFAAGAVQGERSEAFGSCELLGQLQAESPAS
jgi:hypothetical protein